MNSFEYLAYDSTNGFSVIRKQFKTLEEAQKYEFQNMATHSNQTVRPNVENVTSHISDGIIGEEKPL